jgi:hypothetical protein
MMPGQSGDARGFIRLIDTRTNKVLQEKNIEIVQLIDQVSWQAGHVNIKLFADWPLSVENQINLIKPGSD